MMKRITHVAFVAACLALLATTAEAQYPVGTRLVFAWDFQIADVSNGAVTRYEVQVNNGPWVNTGLPPLAAKYEYVIPDLLPVGQHALKVRACGGVPIKCGPEPSLNVTMNSIIPASPTNLRIIPPATPIGVEHAIELANAYALLVIDRYPSNDELQYLASQYSGPFTRWNVIDFLQGQFLQLVVP